MTCMCLFADEFVESSTTIGGYGEMHYDMKANDDDGKLDFHRFIFYIKHQFNSQWSLMSEIEVEHNMVGSYYEDCTIDDAGVETCNDGGSLSSKGGYVAMEQAYLNYWNGTWGWKGGVLLVPAGITNEYHEPPTFMSVERPEYNKYIIPTTWFDNGFAFYGTMSDFNWKVAFTGDLDGDAIGAGIRSGRMKGVSSTTTSWTKTVQGSWTGMTGLKIGGSMTMNDAPTAAVAAQDASTDYVPVWNAETGMWDMEEVVTNAEAAIPAGKVGVALSEFNATYAANNLYARMEYGMISYTDNPDGVESSSGYYLDLGYDIAGLVGCGDDTNLYLWMRTSAYNKDDNDDAKEISLFGVMYKPMNNISFKFEAGTAGDDDVMRLGLGYMF